jgi:acyl-CoA synthetase (AMP-forming)/AMP-acid ligase II
LEIEGVLYEHPEVIEAAVVGVPDAQWGEALKAVVVLRAGATLSPTELMLYCKDRLSPYKVPKSVEFVESLPHTELGKVNKAKVREMVLGLPGQP